jgi:hypothetical protein
MRSVLLMTLVVTALAGAALTSATSSMPARADSGGASSALTRKYPLGTHALCCQKGAPHVRRPTAAGAARRSGHGASLGSDAAWIALLLAGAAALLGVLLTAHRFRYAGGRWLRTGPRRRWPVGERRFRIAQRVGFRYSYERDALVPSAFGGHFGPVLRLRPSASAAEALAGPSPAPSHAIPVLATATRRSPPPAPPASRTIDLACLRLPQTHRAAALWQLTAVDTRSGYTWAELVRQRRGTVPAEHVVRLAHRVAHDLAAGGFRIEELLVEPAAAEGLDEGGLPRGARLVARGDEDAPGRAAEVHERLVERHWRAAFTPPEAPPIEELRRALRRWVGEHNATRAADPRRAATPR